MADRYRGKVVKTKGKGFQLDSTGEEWINISRYADADEAPMPHTGDTVIVETDSKGFARKIETENGRSEPTRAPTTGGGSAPHSATTANGAVVDRLAEARLRLEARTVALDRALTAISYVPTPPDPIDFLVKTAERLHAFLTSHTPTSTRPPVAAPRSAGTPPQAPHPPQSDDVEPAEVEMWNEFDRLAATLAERGREAPKLPESPSEEIVRKAIESMKRALAHVPAS